MNDLSKADQTRIESAAWFKYQFNNLKDMLLYVPGVADFILLVPSKGYGCLIVVMDIGKKRITHTPEWIYTFESQGNCFQTFSNLEQFKVIVNAYLL